MYRFTNEAPSLSKEELAKMRAKLRQISDAELRKEYASSLRMCELNGARPPRAIWIQGLVQVWREMQRRHAIAERSRSATKG